MPKGVYKKPGDISIAKRVTQEQRVLQSSFSNQVEVQISKRPRLMKDQTQQHAVPYEDPCAADNERGAAEHDDKEVAGQGEEDEDEEEEEDEEEDEDKDEDESEDKDDDEKEGASEHDEVKKVEGEGNKEFHRSVECREVVAGGVLEWMLAVAERPRRVKMPAH
jgi:hypothetical protein